MSAEISEKQARSIKYQITIEGSHVILIPWCPSKLPLAKDVDDFVFDDTPINETLVRDLASGNFLAHQRNVVLIGWDRNRQDPPGHRHSACRHPRRRQGAFLQCGRPRQQAGG